MPNETEVEVMPIWQDHERRITTLENTFTGFSHKIDDFDKKISSYEDKIEENSKMTMQRFAAFEEKLDEGNQMQEKLFNRLIEHHLETSKIKLSNFWKFLITLVGGGSFLYILIEVASKFIGG